MLIFLRPATYTYSMRPGPGKRERPDIDAAKRGGDWSQTMDGEGAPELATIEQAHYWTQVYSEILEMEEKVLSRIRHLMSTQTAQVQREVELTNVPVVVAQAERFRQRLGYWEARVLELGAHSPDRRSPDGHLTDVQTPPQLKARVALKGDS
ncbi:MAG: hypothetical protein ABI455_03880 [Candidatus Dormiibacterota bacterium]